MSLRNVAIAFSVASLLVLSPLAATAQPAASEPTSDPSPQPTVDPPKSYPYEPGAVRHFQPWQKAPLDSPSLLGTKSGGLLVAGTQPGAEDLVVWTSTDNRSRVEVDVLRDYTKGRVYTAGNDNGDVWVADEASVYRRDVVKGPYPKHVWTRLEVPGEPPLAPYHGAIVAAAEPGSVYVATMLRKGRDLGDPATVYRIDRNNVSHRVGDDIPVKAGSKEVELTELRFVKGKLFAMATHTGGQAIFPVRHFLMELVDGHWKEVTFVAEANMMSNEDLRGWTTDGSSHMFVGTSTGEVGPYRHGFCWVLTPQGKHERCGKGSYDNLASAAAVGDGTYLLGGAPGETFPREPGTPDPAAEARTVLCMSMTLNCQPVSGLSKNLDVTQITVSTGVGRRYAYAYVGGDLYFAKM